jgi:Ca-activated chloride channel family protein
MQPDRFSMTVTTPGEATFGTPCSPASAGQDGYYMLLLAPPDAAARDALPHDLTRVVDVSGSMSGPKLEQAKAALGQALGAQEFVASLSAGGGTNIEGALDVALQRAAGTGRVALVVFMTDGLPSVGQTEPDQIATASGPT